MHSRLYQKRPSNRALNDLNSLVSLNTNQGQAIPSHVKTISGASWTEIKENVGRERPLKQLRLSCDGVLGVNIEIDLRHG